MKGREVLISTLGTEPQVVTLTLDSLLNRGYNIDIVKVLHTKPNSIKLKEGIERLKEEFKKFYNGISLALVPIADNNHYPDDFTNEKDVATFLKVLYKTAAELKRKGFLIHLSIAGGRKIMAAMGMVVAQLLLRSDDHVWHLLSEDELLQNKAMHTDDPQKVTLIPIPVLEWALFYSTAREILIWDDPYKAIEKQREMRKRESMRVLKEFWESLTPVEQEVAVALVKHGGTQNEIAALLRRSPKTINNHLRSIYSKYRTIMGLKENARVKDRIIVDLMEFLKTMSY